MLRRSYAKRAFLPQVADCFTACLMRTWIAVFLKVHVEYPGTLHGLSSYVRKCPIWIIHNNFANWKRCLLRNSIKQIVGIELSGQRYELGYLPVIDSVGKFYRRFFILNLFLYQYQWGILVAAELTTRF